MRSGGSTSCLVGFGLVPHLHNSSKTIRHNGHIGSTLWVLWISHSMVFYKPHTASPIESWNCACDQCIVFNISIYLLGAAFEQVRLHLAKFKNLETPVKNETITA